MLDAVDEHCAYDGRGWRGRLERSRPVWLATAARLLLSVAVAGAAVLVMTGNDALRRIETLVAGATTGFATRTDTWVNPEAHVYYWAVGTPDAFGTVVATSCSSAFLIGPLLLVALPFLLGRRLPWWRVLGAIVPALTLVFSANVGRLTLISWAAHTFGFQESYDLTHTVVGSTITVGVAVAALCLMLRLLAGRGRLADQRLGAR